MFQRVRQIVADFDGRELLYLRYGMSDFLDGQLSPGSIRFPKTSVNRGSLSEPEDALFAEDGRFNGLGVVEFRVFDIPSRIDQEQGPAYFFFMQHVPLQENYAHSEIWSDQDVKGSDPNPAMRIYRVPSKTVKLRFRIMLAQRIRRAQIRIEALRSNVES